VKRAQFGEFVLDLDTRELLRRGEPRALSPKAFDLLHVLIEHQPKVLSKAELHDYLWPNTFVVEANLSNLIGEIRRALAENPHDPQFVRTVHRIGYAFRGELHADGRDRGIALYRVSWAGGSALLAAGAHLIGRDPDAAVVLESPSVSRHHARISIADGHATFEDLGSKNGSTVDGRPANGPMDLADGDVITVGAVDLKFQSFRPLGSTETVIKR